MKKCLRVLQIVGTMDMGGQETFIMNVYRKIDRDNIQFDFIVHSDKKGYYEEEIEKLGGNIYRITPISSNPIKHCIELARILNKNSYIAVHRHTNSSIVFLDLMIAKFCNIKTRIVHSHSTKTDNILVHKLCKNFLNFFANIRLACSTEAGQWLFGMKKSYEIIPNGINVKDYKYDFNIRQKIRNELNLEDKIVIGHVGRFTEAKNHKFLLEIFQLMVKDNNENVLLLIGTGELEDEIRKYAFQLGIQDKIIFLGVRKDINELLNAIDFFVFPSIYEGLPLSVVEAQANGLKCIISTEISQEVNLTDLVKQIDLTKGAEFWCDIIKNEDINYDREKYNDIIKDTKFDIKRVVEVLEKIYKAKIT